MVKVREGILLLIAHMEPLLSPLVTDLLPLLMSYMFLNFTIICFLLDNFVEIMTIIVCLTLLLFVARTTPQMISWYKPLV